jgi:hypothetical protein
LFNADVGMEIAYVGVFMIVITVMV